MSDDYMVYAYTGDVLSFLDNSVRQLEAVETLSDVEGNEEMSGASEASEAGTVGVRRSSSLFVMCATFSGRRSSIYK